MYRHASLPSFLSTLLPGPAKLPIGVMGHIGAGKTQVIRTLQQDVYKALPPDGSERVVVYDLKGDITEGIPVPDSSILFLASDDPRSVSWNIATDLAHSAARDAFVRAFVAGIGAGLGSNMEALAVAFLHKMIDAARTHSATWSWRELLSAIDTVKAEDSEPRWHVAAEAIRSPLQALVDRLAVVEQDTPLSFSLSEWTRSARSLPTGPLCGKNTLILLDNWRGARGNRILFVLFLAVVFALSVPDSDTKTWLFIEDAGTGILPPNVVNGFYEMPVRGLQCVLGVECLSKLDALYGAHSGADFLRHLSGFVLCRTISPPSLEILSHEYGLSCDEITSLGPTKHGVKTLGCFGLGGDIHKFVWPYVTWPKLRDANPPR